MLPPPPKPDRFPACLAVTLTWEGGYSNHKADPGGPTMKGVTQRVYDGWRDAHSLPRRSVRGIEDNELIDIYRGSYWKAVRGDELPAGVDLCVWDTGMNSGPPRGIRILQKAVGTTEDGHLGAATLAACAGRDPTELVHAYMDERERFLRSLSTFATFGKGWMNRCAAIRAKALVMAGESAIDQPPVAQPLPDPDAQSETQGKAPPEAVKPPVGTEATLATAGVASNVTGFANAFAAIGKMGAVTWPKVLLAFLSEPLILTGLVMTFGSFFTFLWRRRHA